MPRPPFDTACAVSRDIGEGRASLLASRVPTPDRAEPRPPGITLDFFVFSYFRVFVIDLEELSSPIYFGSVDVPDLVLLDVLQHVITGNQVPIIIRADRTEDLIDRRAGNDRRARNQVVAAIGADGPLAPLKSATRVA